MYSTHRDSLKFHLLFITGSNNGIGIVFELLYLFGDDCMTKNRWGFDKKWDQQKGSDDVHVNR